MMKPIKLNQPTFGSLELNEVQAVLAGFSEGNTSTVVNDFEDAISDYLGFPHCLATQSGTSAIHLALLSLGVQHEDTVLCSTFTFAASAFPIKYVGATPVFIDAEESTWNMCPLLLEKAILAQIAKGKKPAAIILVHSYGVPAKMDEILKITQTYKIPLIEDAAEALGATYKGKLVGTFGDFGVYSFNTNKVISTLGGGMLVCKHKEYLQIASLFARQGKIDAPHYEHAVVGYNYTMSSIAAAIGLVQLKKLPTTILKRNELFEYYKTKLAAYTNYEFLEVTEDISSNNWMLCIITPSFDAREKLRIALLSVNIESRPLWKPMHQQKIFSNVFSYVNGVSDALFLKGICLPSSSSLSFVDIDRIVTVLVKEHSNY